MYVASTIVWVDQEGQPRSLVTGFSRTAGRTGADAGGAHSSAVAASTLTAAFRAFLGDDVAPPVLCTTDNAAQAKRAGRDCFDGGLGVVPCAPHWLGLVVVWLSFPPQESTAANPRGASGKPWKPFSVQPFFSEGALAENVAWR